ncbi:hypothetical protein [uncultured Microbulbifer sp.]|uniref:hypothetical protein n=1 Tax=uncultured Microbulbifer sp. TaxID=348147 RepID=UPI0025CCAA39|nr:hypothetical protein [uncultured Microbulbifer sp.]
MSNHTPMSMHDELAEMQAQLDSYFDKDPEFSSEAEAQQWAATQSLAASHAEIDRQYAEKRKQEQYATPTGALYDSYGRLQSSMDDDTIIEIAGTTMRLGDAKTAGLVDGEGFYSNDGEETEDDAEERQESQQLHGQLQLAETLVGAEALERCWEDDPEAIEALSLKAGCSTRDTVEMLNDAVDRGMDELEGLMSHHLPGYDIDKVLEAATSNATGAAEVRRAAVGLARGNGRAFAQMIQRYAKDYGFRLR